MSSTASGAPNTAAESLASNQKILDSLLDLHERFVTRQPNGQRAMIRYLQASGLDFSRRNLVDADFTGGHFQRARMVRTNFERASLYCADLRGVDARAANFKRADIRGASLRHARLTGANFDEADMREAMLAQTDSPQGLRMTASSTQPARASDRAGFTVDFTNCSMKNARLTNAKIKGANFAGALLHGADLKGADLTGAVFPGAVLTGVDMEGVKIDPGQLEGCVVDPTPEALLNVRHLFEKIMAADRWAVTGGAEGAAAVLDGEDLRPLGDALSSKHLTALSAKRTCAIGVDFRGAQLQGAHFDGADLRDASFIGADLRGSSFEGAVLWHANFDGADLRALPLAKGGERSVNLEGAAYTADCFGRSITD